MSLRRIGHGLYDRPGVNSLTKQALAPDYRQVLTALARRDQARMLVDGLTAANDLGLTTAVPARIIVHTDIRRRSIPLGNLTLEFRLTAPSKLYWAGRPAMRVVQALYWLKDLLASEPDLCFPDLPPSWRSRRSGRTSSRVLPRFLPGCRTSCDACSAVDRRIRTAHR